MKPISFRIGVALLAFFLGVVASTIRLRYFTSRPESACPHMASRDEEWHRLFEAGGMSADADTREGVNRRLLCANKEGISDAVRIDLEDGVWCKRADGTMQQAIETESSEYGSYYRHITSTHSKWTVTPENLEFARQVSHTLPAKEYIAAHSQCLCK
jgi:hypothetical protein